MNKNRELATVILNEFEQLLNEKDITIPSDDREDIGEDAARLCGKEYYNLLDVIENILNKNK